MWTGLSCFAHLAFFPLLLASAAASLAAPNPAGSPAVAPSAEPKRFIWAVKGPPARLVLLHSDRQTSLAVSTGEKGATNVRIVHSTLQDAATGAQLGPQYLQLCFQKTNGCQPPISVGPNRTEALLLKVDSSFKINGTFTGAVSLAIDEKAEMDSFDLTVLSTSRGAQGIGAALIAAGIALSWFLTVFVRQQALRADALLPASQVADVLKNLRDQAKRAAEISGVTLPKITARVVDLLKKLSVDQLEQAEFIPPRIRNPFRAPRDVSEQYKGFLADLSSQAAAVAFVLKEGVNRAIAKLSQPNAQQPVRAALTELDSATDNVKNVEEAKAAVVPIISKLEHALVPQPGLAAPAPAGAPAATPSVVEVHVQLQRLSVLMWLVWGLLTCLIGYAVLIDSNPGFGVDVDYIKCFLWGLGVQVAGQQLQQLSPTAITSAFSISFPKT